jgi:hypothetical protein
MTFETKEPIMKHPILNGVATATAAAGAVMLFASPALAATTTTSDITAPNTAAVSCDRGPWQSVVQGTPRFKAGDADGDYLWHDSTGFHLRVTHPGHQRVVFSGEITSSAAMSITPYRLEKGDVVRMSADHRTMVFVLSDYGYVDGVNFHTDCAAAVTVSHLNQGNKVLPTANVYLGAHKAHPSQIPFRVHRHTTA